MAKQRKIGSSIQETMLSARKRFRRYKEESERKVQAHDRDNEKTVKELLELWKGFDYISRDVNWLNPKSEEKFKSIKYSAFDIEKLS